MDPLSVQELNIVVSSRAACNMIHAYLANNLGWLGVVNGFEVLLHSRVIILLRVQVVAELSKNDVLLRCIETCFLCQIDGQDI
jgi:hypothetical protein